MPGDPGAGKRIAITVAFIGAIATVGAAYLANSKSKEQPPSIQQTSSGDNAINVGHDAVITNSMKSAGEEAAERVQACEQHHGMKTAFEKIETPAKIISSGSAEEMPEFEYHTNFHYCAWPPAKYSDGDGYLEINVTTVNGPGEGEASGTDDADRITAPCPQVITTYQFGHMGDYENLAPFTVSANAVLTVEGKPWVRTQDERELPFYPETGEMVVLRSGHYGLESVRCAN
jgi:hypothetical protein